MDPVRVAGPVGSSRFGSDRPQPCSGGSSTHRQRSHPSFPLNSPDFRLNFSLDTLPANKMRERHLSLLRRLCIEHVPVFVSV